jgi:hypothetical protein
VAAEEEANLQEDLLDRQSVDSDEARADLYR